MGVLIIHANKYFETALNRTLGFEGGWSDDPDDSGGKTKYGITEATWKRYWKVKGQPVPYPIRNIRLSDAGNVYKKLYWDDIGMGLIEGKVIQSVVNEIFDAVVNGGGVKLAQRAVNMLYDAGDVKIKEDGVLGPKTAAALIALNKPHKGASLLAAIRGERYIWYKALDKGSQEKFVLSWTRRLV